MIIFGTRGVTFGGHAGEFHCPGCGWTPQPYEHKTVRRFFTQYFIPCEIRITLAAIVITQYGINNAVLIEICVGYGQWFIGRGFKLCVETKIADHQVGISVMIKVAGENPAPPAGRFG